MKKENLFIALFTLMALAAMLGFTHQPESEGGMVTMRVSENINSMFVSNNLTIAYPSGEVENIALEQHRRANFGPNVAIINENLNKIKSKGYRLVSMQQAFSDGILITNYTFEQ